MVTVDLPGTGIVIGIAIIVALLMIGGIAVSLECDEHKLPVIDTLVVLFIVMIIVLLLIEFLHSQQPADKQKEEQNVSNSTKNMDKVEPPLPPLVDDQTLENIRNSTDLKLQDDITSHGDIIKSLDIKLQFCGNAILASFLALVAMAYALLTTTVTNDPLWIVVVFVVIIVVISSLWVYRLKKWAYRRWVYKVLRELKREKTQRKQQKLGSIK